MLKYIAKSDEEINRVIRLAKNPKYQVCAWGVGTIGRGAGKQLLDKLGVAIDFYGDSNPDVSDTEVLDGVFCRNMQFLLERKEHTICFVLVGYIKSPEVYSMLTEAGIKEIITYDNLLNYSGTLKAFFPFMNESKIAVYTCVVGEYDDVEDHNIISENCDYFIISDRKPKNIINSRWIDVHDIVPAYITDPVYQNRYCKMNTDKIFPNYRYSIYHDGNVSLFSGIEKSIQSLGKVRIGVLNQYELDTVYSQALRYRFQRLDYYDKWEKQVKRYYIEGLPLETRVFLCNVLVREHNNPLCKKIMHDWWEEFCAGVRRDQISFPYVVWKNGFFQEDVLVLSGLFGVEAVGKNDYWMYTPVHKKERFHV